MVVRPYCNESSDPWPMEITLLSPAAREWTPLTVQCAE